jgi:uncharacterized protein YndB with AHSA1/START domain
MNVPPAVVWDTLADASSYAFWVVGSKRIRDADHDWPAPGTRFHHTLGVGPLALNDHTESLAAERPRLLDMRAKARPFGTARVTLEMTPCDDGTIVRMTENPDGFSTPLRLNPVLQLLTRLRNLESLARLERLALRRADRPGPG